MIVRSKPTFWALIGIVHLSILPQIAYKLCSVFLFSSAVIVFERRFPDVLRSWNAAPFTLLGVALSIFLGFRNNACYDRWWEARKNLGMLIGEMRSWARLSVTVPSSPAAVAHIPRERLVKGAIAYQYALTAHLRGLAIPQQVSRYAGDFQPGTNNVPDELLRRLGGEIGEMLANGEIGEQIYRLFDERLTAFMAFQVACERIRNTPTPFTYTLLLHRTAYAYCLLLPLGLTSTLGWGAPLFCTLVAYAFFGLDALGDELEKPFGTSLNALPLDALTRTVEISLLEALGETDVPTPLMPVHHLLR